MDRGIVVVARLGKPPFVLQGPAQREMRPRSIRVEGEHALPAGNRLAGLFHLVVQLGQPLPEVGVVGLELDGLLQPDQGVGQLALALQHQPEVGIGERQLRIQPQRFQVGGLGVDEPVQHPQHVAEVVVQHGRVGIQADRLLTVRQRLLGLTAVQQRLAQVGLGRGERRVQLDGAAEMLERLVLLAQLTQRDAQVVVGHHEVRPQLQGAAELFDRLGVLPQTLQGRAQVAEGFRIIRPDRQGRAATADGSFEIAESAIRLGQVRMVNMRVRPQRHRPADQLDRAGMVALLVVQHAEQVQGLGVFLLARQHLLVQLGGRAQLSRSVHLDGGRQHVLHGQRYRPVRENATDVSLCKVIPSARRSSHKRHLPSASTDAISNSRYAHDRDRARPTV